MTENRKVLNAKRHEYDGILFKSGLEVKAYKAFTEAGFNPEYEKHTYVLQDTKLFPTKHYTQYRDRKTHKDVWGLNKYKIVSIKYTPDFIFTIDDLLIVVEIKGYSNDRYPYQKKLFFRWLEDNNPNSAFFEIHNQKQLKEAVNIIKNFSEQ